MAEQTTTKDQKLEVSFMKLDPRWAKFYHEFLKTGKAYKSARKAGFSQGMSLQVRQRWPDVINKSIQEIARKQGLTLEKMVNRTNKLLDAKQPVFKNNNATGQIEMVGERDDFMAINNGLTHAERIYELDRSGEGGVRKHIHVHVDLGQLTPEQKLRFIQAGVIE